MPIRDILSVLDGTERGAGVAALALTLATQHDARLTGFCPLDLLWRARSTMETVGYSEALALDVEAAWPTRMAEQAEQLASEFQDSLQRAGRPGGWFTGNADPPDEVLRLARRSDLVVVGQPAPEDRRRGAEEDLLRHILMGAGRPMLVLPYAGKFETVGRNVLIGWSETRESARAIHDALPLIAQAQSVTALTVLPGRKADAEGGAPAADIIDHLARHGVRASAARTVTDNIASSDALLSYACDVGADLLVVGGYGHSPARERMLGGVTRELLQHMTLPVLLSH